MRWKDNKNKPSPGVDNVLFHIKNKKKYSDSDILVSIESEMKSVESKEHRIQTAITDASKDKLTRLSKSLIWLEEKYAKLGKENQRKMVLRFKDPATFGNFQKQHKAIAIIDKTLETGEVDTPVNNPEGVIAIIFSIDELKTAYETTRNNIIKSI